LSHIGTKPLDEMDVRSQHHATIALPLAKRITGWVGPRANLKIFKETNIYCSLTGFKPWIVAFL